MVTADVTWIGVALAVVNVFQTVALAYLSNKARGHRPAEPAPL